MIESPPTRNSTRPTTAAPAAGEGTTLDGSLSWARPGKRRRPLEVHQGPGPWGLVRAALVASGLGALAWLVTLVVAALAEGRPATYPFAAVTALFRGARALGLPPHVGEVSTAALVRGVLWTALVAVLLGGLYAVVSLKALPRRRVVVIAGAALAALAVLGLGSLVFGQPGSRALQREVSSAQGFRDLGLPAVVLAQVLAGVVFGSWWARCTCRRDGS